MEELKEQAESLGIKVDGRWSAERIQAEIDKALAADPVAEDKAQNIVINVTPAPGMSKEEVSAAVQEAMAKPSAKQAVHKKEVTVTNLRDNPNKRLGLKGRGSVDLTAEQMADEKFMARIAHGVETGVLGLA